MIYTEAEITAALHKVDPKIKTPTPEQSKIISAPLDPAIVIAGAGSGKTETMASRVLFLVANRLVKPNEILGLTFTRKAAGELAIRVRLRLRQLAETGLIDRSLLITDPTILTYHSYASKIVADYGLRHGVDSDFTPLGEAALFQLASEVVSHHTEMDADVEVSAKDATDHVISLSRLISEHGSTIDQVRRVTEKVLEGVLSLPGTHTTEHKKIIKSSKLRLALLPMVERFDELRRDRNAFSFDDQMSMASTIAQEFSEIGEAERVKFKAVLLDEYQDTSQSQLRLLSALYGSGHPVMAVGDPFQSIYGWRGASADTMSTFFSYFPSPRSGESRYSLSISWRNDQAILTAANDLIREIQMFQEGGAGKEVVQRLSPRKGAGTGEVLAGAFLTLDEEAEAIADFFALRCNDESTSAVLVRSRTQIEVIEQALRARGLPVDVVGIGGLLYIPEVVEVIALLKAIAFTDRGVALARLLTSERYAIGAKDLLGLSTYARLLINERSGGVKNSLIKEIASGDPLTLENEGQFVGNIVEALDLIDQAPRHLFSSEGLRRLREARRDIQRVRERSGSLMDITLEAIRTLGLEVEVMVRDGIKDGMRHLHRFIDEVARFQSDGGTLSGFLEWIDYAIARESGLKESEVRESKGRIQIITVHGAKGLEWDFVAVPGLRESGFPSTGRGLENWLTDAGDMPFSLRGDRDQLPRFDISTVEDCKALTARQKEFTSHCRGRKYLEELRLGYVAFTRARKSLMVSLSHFKEGVTAEGPSQLFDVAARSATRINEFDGTLPDGPNPSLERPRQGSWPHDALRDEREAFDEAVKLYEKAPDLDDAQLEELDRDLFAVINEERSRRSEKVVMLPERISVSMLEELYKDPNGLAIRIRRPMPSHTNLFARRGTEFHAWVERYLNRPQIWAEDEWEWDEALSDTQLKELKDAWLSSEWASRTPLEVEFPFEVVIDGTLLRGRIDAIYQDPRDIERIEVVDWKTGRVKSGDDLSSAATQLAAYRLAVAKLFSKPLESISAAFHYVEANETIRPADLLDEKRIIQLLPRWGDDR
ncbi:MAG: ATP-dependent helicase [Candidatus Nanopelagicaceae bacterium]